MKPDVGDLPFTVELKLQLSQLSFGEHVSSEIISPTSDFSKIDTLGEPVFAGRCFFGRNNLGRYPDENFGINCQCHDYEESRTSDGILGTVFNIDKADYSFAQVYQVYAENERSAQVDIFLNPNILKKIHLAKNAVIFQLVTFFNENKKMSKDQFRDKDREPNNIIIEGEPGHISTTNKFTLDIGKKEFGQWLFRVRLAFLDFPSAENPTASKISRNRNRTRRSCHHRYPSPAASHRAPILLTLAPSELHPNFRFWLYPEVTEASPEVRFQAPSGHRCGHSII